MDITTLIIQLLSGAVGGNVVGPLVRKICMGVLGNSIAGILGGGLGGQILGGLLGMPTGGSSLDIGSILGLVASGGVGGGVVMVIIGMLKNMLGGRR
jgi:hypothetical protein